MLSLPPKKFKKIVELAVAEVPNEFLEKLNNIAIVIQDLPTQNQKNKLNLKKGILLLGLYEGVPQVKRWGGGVVLPDKITVFKKSIESLSNSEEDIKRIVKDTVQHEIAHHFGMSEEEIRRSGKR